MAKTTIRSHRARVQAAKDFLATSSRYSAEKISLLDREAFVEFFLLEDIYALYEMRLANAQSRNKKTLAGKYSKEANIRKFKAFLDVLGSAMEVAEGMIESGEYSTVRRAIPEALLMIFANSVKFLPTLTKIATEMYEDLSGESLEAEDQRDGMTESVEETRAHEENVRRAKALPDFDPGLAATIEEVLPATDSTRTNTADEDKKSAKRRRSRLDND